MNYTVQAAVADVLTYHGACSIIAGMEQAGDAIQEIENPGPRMVRKVIAQQRHLQEMQTVKDPKDLKWGVFAQEVLSSPSDPAYNNPFAVVQLFLDKIAIEKQITDVVTARKEALTAQGEKLNKNLMDELESVKGATDSSGSKYLSVIQSKYENYVKATLLTKAKDNAFERADILARQAQGQLAAGEQVKLREIENESRVWLEQYEIIQENINKILNVVNDSTVTSPDDIKALYKSFLAEIP